MVPRGKIEALLGALLMELDEKWGSGNRYLDMAEYLKWREKHREAQKQASKVHRLD